LQTKEKGGIGTLLTAMRSKQKLQFIKTFNKKGGENMNIQTKRKKMIGEKKKRGK
jgi:hypothetical protein